MKEVLITLAVTALLCGGCASIWTNIVTVSQVRDSIMTELGILYKAGKIDAATDKKIADADAKVRAAAAICEQAIVAYKLGQENEPVAQLQAVKLAVNEIINILSPFITAAKTDKLQTQLVTAKTL